MNKALLMISNPKRLQVTPLAYGGNIIIHRKMFEKVPFDPWTTRGEDMDLVLNARLFGFIILLDNKLYVIHKPIKKYLHEWSKMRQDLFRFSYMRKKISFQLHNKKTKEVYPSDLDPFPGHFLRRGILPGYILSNFLYSVHSVMRFKFMDSKEHIRNIVYALHKASRYAKVNATNYMKFQKEWVKVMRLLKKDKFLKKYLLGKC